MLCDYCGGENDELAAHCGGCGKPLAMENLETDKPASAEGELNGRSATFILLVYFGVQIGSGAVFGILAVFCDTLIHGGFLTDQAGIAQRITGPVVVLTFIASGAAMILLALARVRQHLFDTSST